MVKKRPRRDVTVLVQAAFDAAGVWIIKVHVRFREGLPPNILDALPVEARRSLIEDIKREDLRGQELGAMRVLIEVDDGDGPALIEPAQLLERLEPTD